MKIFVYDDNPDYGGHQIMACQGVEALTADPAHETTFMCNPDNRRLADRLAGIANIKTAKTPCTERYLELLKPDLVLCIQGDIRQSTRGVDSARRARIKCVSYLALPHTRERMGSKFGTLRDHFNRHLLNRPDRYITISESMKQLMIERGCTRPIDVVPNGITTPTAPTEKLTSHASRLTLGMLGRIEFNQKRQDFMVQTFCAYPEVFKDCKLVIAGDGPDRKTLESMVRGNENISLLPWQDPDAFYKTIDVLMIPSRFEGVPLVMLEALARGIPVIGSNRDGMKDLLPETWTFDAGNGESLAGTFAALHKNGTSEITALQDKVLVEHSLETFKSNFHRAVIKA